MDNCIRMERNRGETLRITEIPPEGEFETLECPYCHSHLQVGLCKDGSCKGITVYCRKCKRRLIIDINKQKQT